MPYRLKPNETVPEGVRRVVIEEIDCALQHLGNRGTANQDEAIHSARKSMKKIRGALRMMRPELGSSFNKENAAVRDAGRGLSELRDAGAVLETVDHLAQKYKHELKSGALDAIRRGLEEGKREQERSLNPRTAMQTAAQALEALRKRVPKWPLSLHGFTAIEPGLKQSYRDGRRALRAAGDDPNALNFHELRKRTKDHWYHTRLIESAWPEGIKARQKSAHQVESCLGEDHNLYVLRCRFEENPERFGGEEEVHLFLALAGREQAELRSVALAEGRRLFQQRPRDFAQHLRGLWRIWHEEELSNAKSLPRKPASRAGRRKIAVA